VSDEQGAWRLAGLVERDGVFVRTRLEGYEDDLRPAAALLRGQVGITLRLRSEPLASLAGRVTYPDGRPAAGAAVRAGERIVRADREGRFELSYDRSRPPRQVVAGVDGWQPAVETLPPPGSGGGPGPFRELRLAGQVLAIEGVLAGPKGQALPGWEVLAADEEGDPRYPELAPGAPVARTRTDADGSFRLGELLDRSYTLRAYDPATLAMTEPHVVPAGRRGLRLTARDTLPEPREGRVTTPGGRPVPFARLAALAPLGGGERARGPWVTADALGRFVLPTGGRAQASVLVPKPSGFMAVLAGGGGAVVVPRDAWFVYAGGGVSSTPDRLQVLDASGQPMVVHGPSASGLFARLSPLHGGRSPVLRTTEAARTLVLYRGATEVGRLPLVLVPGEVVVVGGKTAAGSVIIGTSATGTAAGPIGTGGKAGGGPGPGPATPGGGQKPGNSVTPGAARQP
jgi:hypothetical protein